MNVKKITDTLKNKIIEVALKSDQHHNHGALLVKNNKIITEGYNSHRGILKNQICCSIHAEQMALLCYYGPHLMYDIRRGWYINKSVKFKKKLDIIVARVGKKDNMLYFKDSYPCEKCLDMMRNIGIKNCIYSTGKGDEFIITKVNNMKESYMSIGLYVIYFVKKYGYHDSNKIHNMYAKMREKSEKNNLKKK
jgi:deoxycytidylate deaminase